MDIAQNVLVSNFICGASLASCMRHIRFLKFILRILVSCEYFKSSEASTFGVIHLDDKTLAPWSDSDAVLPLEAAPAYLSSPTKPKDDFPCHHFQSAAYRYVQTLRALFSFIRFFNKDMFAEDRFTEFLASEVLLTFTMATTMLNVIQTTWSYLFMKAVTVGIQ